MAWRAICGGEGEGCRTDQFRITIEEWRFIVSARKHGVGDEDIQKAGGGGHFVVAYRIDDVEPLRELRLGFDTAGRLLEVVVLVLDDGRELAIHAMRARPQYLDLLP